MLFICYPKCSTCQKAKKWLDEHELESTERPIAENNPTYDELKEWYSKSGLPIKKFFNTFHTFNITGTNNRNFYIFTDCFYHI